MKLEVIEVPLSELRTNEGTQFREALTESAVVAYAEMVDLLEPIDVVSERVGHDRSLIVANGFHRIEAHRRAGRETIKARVHEADITLGAVRTAVLLALRANARNGVPLTRSEKRAAVERMLRDFEWRDLSDHKIAAHCGVSQTFVSRLRGEMYPSSNTANEQEKGRFENVVASDNGKAQSGGTELGKKLPTFEAPAPAVRRSDPTRIRPQATRYEPDPDVAPMPEYDAPPSPSWSGRAIATPLPSEPPPQPESDDTDPDWMREPEAPAPEPTPVEPAPEMDRRAYRNRETAEGMRGHVRGIRDAVQETVTSYVAWLEHRMNVGRMAWVHGSVVRELETTRDALLTALEPLTPHEDCGRCDRTGFVGAATCLDCLGQGWLTRKRAEELRVNRSQRSMFDVEEE